MTTNIAIVELKKMPGGGSDRTLKKNVTPLTGVLNKVLSLRPVTWNWKTDKSNASLEYGFIAQEVEEILPQLVSEGEWEDGTKRKFLTTNEMLPYLVAAIKEQQKEIEQLQKTITKLQTPQK